MKIRSNYNQKRVIPITIHRFEDTNPIPDPISSTSLHTSQSIRWDRNTYYDTRIQRQHIGIFIPIRSLRHLQMENAISISRFGRRSPLNSNLNSRWQAKMTRKKGTDKPGEGCMVKVHQTHTRPTVQWCCPNPPNQSTHSCHRTLPPQHQPCNSIQKIPKTSPSSYLPQTMNAFSFLFLPWVTHSQTSASWLDGELSSGNGAAGKALDVDRLYCS